MGGGDLARAQITDAARETTHLMVLEGNGTRFLDGVEGPQTLRVGFRTGTLLPAHPTSGGKDLLGELPLDRLRALYANGLPGDGAVAPRDFERLATVAVHQSALNAAAAPARSLGHAATKVVTLRAGSVAVKEPFDTPVAPWGATFLLASVNQDEALDAVLFARVNR